MKLVVGLGNPGREYVGTRHNVGFDVIDRFAEKLGWVPAGGFDRVARTKFESLSVDGVLNTGRGESEKMLLLKPTTYMNLSGRPVQQACAFYQLAPADVLIVLDDLALPCGKIRLRAGGSSGGHNGLRDIEKMLGTQAYPRLRVGIDAPPPRVPGRDYVLGRWTDEQQNVLPAALDRAAGAIATWAEQGIEKAMSLFNVSTVES